MEVESANLLLDLGLHRLAGRENLAELKELDKDKPVDKRP